jgi:hypothetical protein
VLVDIADSDSSVEEFEDASESFNGEDEIFAVDVQTKKPTRLSEYTTAGTSWMHQKPLPRSNEKKKKLTLDTFFCHVSILPQQSLMPEL